MYFYAITGKQNVKTITETTNDEGEIILVTTITEVDVKTPVSQRQANEYVKNGTYPVYAVYDDGTEELIELYDDSDPPEILVGASPSQVDSRPLIVTTEETINVPRTTTQENDYRLTTSFTPTKTDYQLLGVVGFRVIGSSNILPFRIDDDNGIINIGLKNTSTTHVDSVNVKLNLLWLKNTAQSEVSNEQVPSGD